MKKSKKIAKMVKRRLKVQSIVSYTGEHNNHILHVPGSQNLKKG